MCSVCRQDVNKKRYDTVTFLVGDREFYALGFVLESACPGMRNVLQKCDDLASPIELPTLPFMSDAELYECFALLVEVRHPTSFPEV